MKVVWRIAWLLAVHMATAACMEGEVVGNIPPSTFEFVTVVEPGGPR